jgi:hypothetical protein
MFLAASLSGSSKAVTLQHIFIIISGFGFILIPFAFNKMVHEKPIDVEPVKPS